MMGFFDTTLGRAFERAGVSRLRARISECARNAVRAHKAEADQAAGLARLLRRDPDLMIELWGQDRFDAAVLAEVRRVKDEDSGRTPHTDDGDAGHMMPALNGHKARARSPSTPSGDGGQSACAAPGHDQCAASPEPNREAGGQAGDASNGHASRAAASLPRRRPPQPKVRQPHSMASMPLAVESRVNRLVFTYMVGGKPIGEWRIRDGLDWAEREIRRAGGDIVRATALKLACQRVSVEVNGDMLVHEAVGDEVLQGFIEQARAKAAAEIMEMVDV